MSENQIPPTPHLLSLYAQATEVGKRKSAVQYQPLYDRLLVRIITAKQTKGGLVIPDMAIDNTPYLKAEVLATGQGRISTSGNVVPLQVKVGDVVVFFRSQSSGEQLVFPSDAPGEELMLIREPNVAAILLNLDKVTSIVGIDGGNLELSS